MIMNDIQYSTAGGGEGIMAGTEVVVRLVIQRLNHLLEGLEEVGLTGEHVEGMKIRYHLLRMAQFIRPAEDSIPILEESLKSVMPWWEWDEMVEKAHRLEKWTERLQDIAFTTEDVIDDFRLHVFHCPYLHHPNAFVNLLHKCCWILRRQIHLRHLLRTRIRYIGERVLESSKQQLLLLQDQDNDGLRISPAALPDHDARIRIPCWIDHDDDDPAVGTDKGRDLLLQWLLEDEAELKLVAVTGYEGTGITTLAKQVYHTPLIKKHFDCHVWVPLTRRFRIQSMLLRMIQQFHPHKAAAAGRWTLRELFKQVAGYLRDKRYLIVLDDVYDRDDLNCVFHAFPDSLCGSRLMITTEIYDIAISARGRICYVWPLSWEDAWEVFRRKAFPPDGVCPVELENVARSVVHVCDGLPLSIVVAAGFLPFEHQSRWLRIVQILRRVAASNPNPDYKVLTRLIQLSFDNLPYYLKSCLLYFCMFQEDAPIKGKRLIQLWASEGIIQARDNKTAEEVAEECLGDLIGRNLVQPSQYREDGRLRSCQVHRLIRDQILEVAKEGHILAVAQADNLAVNSNIEETGLYSRVRRPSIQDDFDQDANLSRFRNFRSLFISRAENVPESLIQTTIASFRLLKVLVLEGIPLDRFPVGVENLLLLKYLGLRHLQVTELPRSIGSLVDLETLDLKCSQISTLPGEILKLKRLRHLLVCHHTTHGVSVPTGIGTLTSLQTLGYIDVLEVSAGVGELRKLINLRRLCITNLNRGDGRSLCSSIEKMVRLCSLKVMFSNEDGTLDLQAMSSPPAGLRRLYLKGRLERCPGWVKLLQNIVKMGLSGSRLRHDPFGILKSLPNLAILVFVRAYEGEELCCDAAGFPSLRVLKLVELHSLEVLNVEEGGFTYLEELHIRHCPNLKKFPSSTQLWLSIMPEEAKRQLQQDREDGEGTNLPVIRIITIIGYILKIAMVIATVRGTFYAALSSYCRK